MFGAIGIGASTGAAYLIFGAGGVAISAVRGRALEVSADAIAA
jgi:hypothetical protein